MVESVAYTLIAADGTEIPGATVVLDDDDNDLCMFQVAGNLGRPIPIGDRDPPYAAEGYYVGAPHGIWGGGIAGYYTVRFSGRGTPWNNKKEALAFSTASAAPGASGSPYMYDGQAVALLNLGSSSFFTFSTGVPWDQLKTFVAKALHKQP